MDISQKPSNCFVVLFSTSDDVMTDRISKILCQINISFIWVTPEDLITEGVDFSLSNWSLKFGDKWIDRRTVRFVWFYRFSELTNCECILKIRAKLNSQIADQVESEIYRIGYSLPTLFPYAEIVGDTSRINTNKIIELNCALQSGLEVPQTLICSSKDTLETFYKAIGTDLVSKSLFNAQVLYVKDKKFSMYTTKIGSEEISVLPKKFLPSLIQQRISRKFEVRVFYFLGAMEAVKIDAVEHNEYVDIRKNSGLPPYCFSEYIISNETADHVRTFMKDMDLTMGSLDFIMSMDNQFYFLEVNNNGQISTLDEILKYKISSLIISRIIRSCQL